MANYREPGSDNPLTTLLEQVGSSQLRNLMICLPGIVTAFDSARQRAQIQVAINRVVNGEPVSMPVIENVPVQFSGDGEWYMWHQITPAQTEGLIHFSQRAIDTWIEQGGITTPVDYRIFSAKDAFFAPGYRSNAAPISGFMNEGCGMSNYSGSTRIHLTNQGVNIKGGAVNIESGSLTHNGVNVGQDHVHPITGGSSAPGPTGGPQ